MISQRPNTALEEESYAKGSIPDVREVVRDRCWVFIG